MGRKSGVTEQQLTELAEYQTSPAFSATERLVIEYADLMTRTPVDMPDELFQRLKAQFNEAQIVELTAEIAWENYRARSNHALGVEAQGFSEGAFCVLPQDTTHA